MKVCLKTNSLPQAGIILEQGYAGPSLHFYWVRKVFQIIPVDCPHLLNLCFIKRNISINMIQMRMGVSNFSNVEKSNHPDSYPQPISGVGICNMIAVALADRHGYISITPARTGRRKTVWA